MESKNLGSIVAIAMLMASAVAHAQSIRPTYQFPLPPSSDDGPAAIQMGSSPFYFSPYVGGAVGHDDNVLLTSANERSSTLYIVSPGFKIDGRSANTVLQAGYQGHIGRYASSSEDDYSNHYFTSQFDMAFDRRNFMRLGLDYTHASEPRGSTDRPLSNEPDKYRLTVGSATYAFGAHDARGRLEIYGAEARKRYINNREITASGDRANRMLGTALYVRVAPRTYAMAEVRGTRIRYTTNIQQDADERRYYAGLAWDASAATRGTLKFGRLERETPDGRNDFSGTGWEVAVSWAPRSYSRFDLYSERQTNESTGLGDFIITDSVGINWTHDWNSKVSTGVNLAYYKDKYQGFDRKDDTMSLGLKVGYKFRRWVTFGAEYNYIERDSNLDTSDYDRNRYFLTATATL